MGIARLASIVDIIDSFACLERNIQNLLEDLVKAHSMLN